MPDTAQPKIEKIRPSLELFKTTGQIDPQAIELAKEILLSSGIDEKEIANIGPADALLKVQELLEQPKSSEVTKTTTNLGSEIENLSKQLTQEIDEEIRRQLSQRHSLDNAQNHFNELVKEPKLEETTATTPTPTPTQPQLTKEQVQSYNLNPKAASVEAAFSNLKEGSKINDEWVLQRIYSTTFGNNKTFFYELKNIAGSIWTLNQEEMKHLLSQQIDSSQNKPQYESLQPPEQPSTSVNHEPQSPFNQEVKKDNSPEEKVELSKEQIDLLKKIFESATDWQTLVSLTPSHWQTFWNLYQKGNLLEIGIDSNPLIEKLKDSENYISIEIKKGENIQKILTDQGYQITYTAKDALLLGLHLLLNYLLVKTSHEKIENSGISLNPLPKEEEIIPLIKKALSEEISFSTLKDSLTFLPVNGHFKVLKADKFSLFQGLA